MADALSDAKKALASADKKFPTSMARAAGVNPPAPVKAPKAAMPAPKPAGNPEGNVGGEIADKVNNVAQYNQAVPKMHKGGTKKGEGLALLKDDETVRTKEQENKVQEKLKGTKAKDLMTKDEPKEKKEGKSEKSDKKDAKKKKHPFKRTIIDHHSDGQSHTMTHEHETDPTQNVTSAKESLDGVHDGLEENIGGPAEAAPQAAPAPAGAMPGNAGAV